MEKSTKRMDIGGSKKFQDAMKRVGELKLITSGIERAASKLLVTARKDARKIEAISNEVEKMRKLHVGSKKISKFGNLVGKLGQIAGRETPENAAEVFDDAAKPMVKQILKTAKNVLDALDKAADHAEKGLERVQRNSIESCRKLKVQTKRILVERATSMATKIRTFARQTYGGFMSQEQLDEMTEAPISQLMEKVSGVVSKIDSPPEDDKPNPYYIPDEKYDEDIVNEMKNQHQVSRDALLSSAIRQAIDMVGEELAREVAYEVFGKQDVDSTFDSIPRSRGLVDGVFGAAKTAVTGAGKIGSSAIGEASNLVKNIAVGKDGQSGLMGKNGLANSILDTAGGVANKMLDTAKSMGDSIFGNKSKEVSGDGQPSGSKGALGTAKDVAGSMVDCVSGVGNKLIDGLGKAAKGAAGLVGDVAKGLADFASNAWDAATDMAKGLGDSISDMLGLSDEEIEDTVDDVADEADDMMDEAEDDMEDLLDEEEQDLENLYEEGEKMENEWDEKEWDEDWEDWKYPEDWENEDWEEPEWDWYYEDEYPYYPEDDDGGSGSSPSPSPSPSSSPSSNSSRNNTPEPSSSSTTPMGNDSPSQDNGIQPTKDRNRTIGWKAINVEVVTGLTAMMHDGDQQLFNPYGPETGGWTMYSFRPSDAKMTWPQIAITPSSFEAIRSMDTMLNNVPFVVVKEYFFKNTASTMIDFVKKIAGMVQGAKDSPKDDTPADSGAGEQSSQGAGDAKSSGGSFMDKVKEIFNDIPLKPMVIDIPYILYFCLRQKVYGNTYIFPYIVQSGSTEINGASNESEWDPKSAGGLFGGLKNMISGAAKMVGDIAMKMSGSQGQVAENIFPAPSWGGAQGEKASFTFELILINDNVVKARNNYMCANTIIHNNRSIQKAILTFPGALYEVWLPTGQRHLMCTGSFKLMPIGLNRMTPNDFFKGGYEGANLRIGVDRGDAANIQNPEKLGHRENGEVLPDAYKLSITFKSCIASNMNTAVFQYYVKMTGYDAGPFDSPTSAGGPGDKSNDDVMSRLGNSDAMKSLAGKVGQMIGGGGSSGASGASASEGRLTRGVKSIENMRMGDILDSEDFKEFTERFNEATYNKKLGKLRTDIGDQAVNSESAVQTIRKAQSTVKDISSFLARLYNAPDNNLWYREDPKDELYTTLKPDYRKMLRSKYQAKMGELRSIDSQMKQEKRKLSNIDAQISTQFDLDQREILVGEKVHLTRSLNALAKKREAVSDEIIQIDTDLIQRAFDEQDSVVSVAKMDVGFRIFQQVWNEKIMNQYEKDKLQYLTSQEKERYFKEKLRDLEKFDEHGVLRKPDWFFRVVVLDYIVGEMKRLILWFKDCSWDDFETVYKITRKLRMLQLDVDSALSDKQFDINHTNLFQVSDDDVKDYTKIDKMLQGNTLYELFSSIIRVKVVKFDDDEIVAEDETKPMDKEVAMDRKSEIDTAKQRTIRQDVVVRYWGSESELTKEAYDIVNRDVETPTTVDGYPEIDTLGKLKDEIIRLKLDANRDESKLKTLLGALVNQVGLVKEALVIEKMNEMHTLATSEIEKKDDSANAKVVDFS